MAKPKTSNSNGNGRINWPLYNLLSMIVVGCFITIGVATDKITTAMMISSLEKFGLPGIILVFWYVSNRGYQRTSEQNQRNMERYHDDVIEMKQMYENNVRLVEKYVTLSGDLKDVLILNTQALTEVCTDIRNNVFCPMTREKMGE
jgi:hypothetical protein